MNEIVQYRNSSATLATMVGLTAALAAGYPIWPAPDAPAYVTKHDRSTFSFFEKSVTFAPSVAATDFGHEIAAVYTLLSEGQEPLGAEFEAIWDENVASLYEA